jgi:hypothetical protein
MPIISRQTSRHDNHDKHNDQEAGTRRHASQ